MQHQPSTPALSFAQRIALAGLLLCVALVQSITLAHRALHHDVRMLAHTYEEQHADHHASGADCVHEHGLWSRLFASHEQGDESCRLLDAANPFFDHNQPPALVFPAPSAHVFIAFNASLLSAWQAALFEARAPPVLSL
jgi:hypothetical protein